ncbi:MAG: Stp1/IreP family PP2C-type Ser/Thr phosphatase [Actinomycetes bacterium]
MIEVASAGGTHQGRVRRNNQDSYLVGDSVFAVADGMGGHLAGEIASATALGPVTELDGRVYADQGDALGALVSAVSAANRAVVEKAAGDENYRGMGTTLTATMLEGARLHLAHVGDSRAYLLRGGELSQLTRDHTLVQHLIDEGQITVEQAAVHPQRSIVTRAVGVSRDVEVDAMSLDLEPGDVVLLCSDGLSGVVADGEIARVIHEHGRDLHGAVDTLITMANQAGGPDNVTVVLLRAHPPGEAAAAPAAPAATEDGEAPATVRIRTDAADGRGDWADRLGNVGDRSPAAVRRKRRVPLWVSASIVTLVALVAVAAGGRWLLSRSWYVGLDGDRVAIYQGIPPDLGPFELSWIAEETSLTVSDLPAFYVEDLREGIPAIDRADARRIVSSAPRVDRAPDTTEGSDPTGSTDPTDGETSEPSPTPPPTPGGTTGTGTP